MKTKTSVPAKAPRFVIVEGDEDFTINFAAKGQTHAIVPFKPVLSAKRELYRDRLTKAHAKVTADNILAALNA